MNAKATHWEDVKAAIRKQCGSLAAFEAARGLPRRSATDVGRGRSISNTESAIADLVGKPLHVLFPSRYEAPADSASTNADNNRSARKTQRQNAGVE